MNKQHRASSLMILIVFLLLIPKSVMAQPLPETIQLSDGAQRECVSLDVIFLIDQSSSMSGYAGAPASDPNKQREYAVEAVIDQLADIALDRCPDSEHRLAVVSYGTDVRVDLGWSNIDPETFEDTEYIRDLLKPKVVADDLGQTNPKLAFEQAAALFAQLPEAKQETRKKVIIFITDGIPYIDGGIDVLEYVEELQSQIDTDFPFSETLLGLERCIAELRTRYGKTEDAPESDVNNCIKRNLVSNEDYQNSTYIWMILLKSFQPYPRGVLDTYEEIAQSHAGELIELSQNRNEIPTTFRTILANLAGVKASLLQCGKFAVNPYLKRATLNIFKLNEDLKVTLAYSAGGDHYEITGGVVSQAGGFNVAEYYAFGSNERYVFTAPYPGLWDLRADDCTGLDAFYEEVQINVGYQEDAPTEWPQYDRPPYFDEEKPLYMEIQMLDEAGQVVSQADHPQFAVDVVMTVTQPDNKKEIYKMEWDDEDKVFRATEPLKVPVPGNYRIDIVGTTHKHEGEPAPLSSESYSDVFSSTYELFRLNGYELSVFPVTPFQIKILSPGDGTDLGPVHGTLMQNGWSWPLPINPISVRAQILDEQGNPLDADIQDVFTDPENALVASVTDQTGKSAEIILQPDPENPGIYSGEWLGFDGEGRLALSVTLQSDYDVRFRPLTSGDRVEVYRSDPLLHRERFYVTVLYTLITLLVLGIILWLIGLRNPLHGALVFYEGASICCWFSIATSRQKCCRYRKVLGRKDLKRCPQLGLRKIEIRWQRQHTTRKKTEAPDGLEIVSAYFDANSEAIAHRGVTMKCWPMPKGRPYTVDLMPDVQTPYSSEQSVIQVKYEP